METTDLSIDTGGRHVLVPPAPAGLAVMETGSGSEEDLEEVLGRLLPRDDRWAHRHGSRGHGADHLLPVFAGPSLTVPVQAPQSQKPPKQGRPRPRRRSPFPPGGAPPAPPAKGVPPPRPARADPFL